MKSRSHQRCSLTASFLTCTAFIYIGMLGTQFKMMSVLGKYGHSNHVADGVKNTSPKRGQPQPTHDNNSERHRQREFESHLHNEQQSNPEEELYKTMSESIAKKWNLTTPNAVELLDQQFRKKNDYDPQRDFFHFHHLYKSGGTSISGLMDMTVGLPWLPREGDYYEGILPGSHQSGNFDHETALRDINRRLSQGTKRQDLPYRASYAHTGLRPMHGPRRTKTGVFFLKHLPHKRFRMITMLRDITDFRASNHAMIMCGLNYEVTRFNNERVEKGLEWVCSPEDGLNISALIDRKTEDLLEKCRTRPDKINSQQRQQCKDIKDGIDVFAHCRSVSNLFASAQYDKHYRSMFKALMGRFHRGQKFTNSTAYRRMGYGFERAEDSDGYSLERVEEYTLQDLGGLLSIRNGEENPPEPDFIWFGITERMKESTTLFHFYFKSTPAKTPIHRVQECRPTSWWTAKDRERVKEREPADYAVWRAANAILDVRMAKMKMEIQSLLDAGETRESLHYVDWETLEEIDVAPNAKK